MAACAIEISLPVLNLWLMSDLYDRDPHINCDLHYACATLDQARLVVIALHGRYGRSADILKLAEQVNVPDVAWIAPQATGQSWWPNSFLAPLAMNEPGLSSALNQVSAIADHLQEQGFKSEQVVLTGFSQGACLVLEHAARHPRPWRAIVAMSGGLLGSGEGDDKPRKSLNDHAPKLFEYSGKLPRLPIYMGCHENDPVIPIKRVQHSAEVLRRLGAQVELHVSPGKMHGILPHDISVLRNVLLV